jgi:hypothetical protein
MDSKKVIEWIYWVFDDGKVPDWFLLPYTVVDELTKDENFDVNTHLEIAGASGIVGVLRSVPVRIGWNTPPCYGEKLKVFKYEGP